MSIRVSKSSSARACVAPCLTSWPCAPLLSGTDKLPRGSVAKGYVLVGELSADVEELVHASTNWCETVSVGPSLGLSCRVCSKRNERCAAQCSHPLCPAQARAGPNAYQEGGACSPNRRGFHGNCA